MPTPGTFLAALPPFLPACMAALVVAAVAAAGAVLARGSTAVPAALWASAAGLCLAVEMGCRAAGWCVDPGVAAAVRLGTVAVAACPTMSLLGAKRPQYGVWQFIVASLGAVLALPALSAALVRPGTPPDVHMLERCFMLVLALIGWMNFAGTRRAVAAAFATVGLVVLMRDLLPVTWPVSAAVGERLDTAAALLLTAGAVVALIQSIRGRRGRDTSRAAPAVTARIERPFLALRETLGAAWTLRIIERFNTVATARGWPCRLSFNGLEAGGDPADTTWHRDALRAFRAIMGRFVTGDWLRRHGWE